METDFIEVSMSGRKCKVPSINVNSRTIIAIGKWVKVASIFDEFYVASDSAPNLDSIVTTLRRWKCKPDIFKFAIYNKNTLPYAKYSMELDNLAVIPITTYNEWLQGQVKEDVKKGVRKTIKDGLNVKLCEYNDGFVLGIKSIYDETPIRQGKPFWHYNKSFEEIKTSHETYKDRSNYIGAYFEDELIGFIKLVRSGSFARTMQILSKDKYHKKRPTTALIAKAVEICEQNGIKYLAYGKYEYPGKKENSLTDFKTRHGFMRFDFPRYYIPLTLKGNIYLNLGLHLGIKRIIPIPIMQMMIKTRSFMQREVLQPIRLVISRNCFKK